MAKSVKASSEVRPVYWNHWEDPKARFDPLEKANLLDSVSGKRSVDIIAKSIGTLVASYLIQKSPEKIRRVVFCGIPVSDIDENEKGVIKGALRIVPPENIIIFQNNEDPHGSFGAVKNFLSEFGSDIQIVSKERDDHEYFYQDEFNQFLLG
jgi:pimeloyl-ACP methyl ester carboxylesterase